MLFSNVVIHSLFALVLGLMMTLVYLKSSDEDASENLPLTLLTLPLVVSVIVMLIGNNIAGAFSLAGIFALIKFRSALASARDLSFLLFGVVVGLAIGVNELLTALVVAIILSATVLVAGYFSLGKNKKFSGTLKILVPEDQDLDKMFDRVLQKYTTVYRLDKMQTKDLGSVFEVVYLVKLKNEQHKKKLLDEVRVLNDNLTVNYISRLKKSEL
jgi:hypothetical protein